MTGSVIESQVAALLAKYSPTIEAQLREARTRLRAMFPRGFELIYDNYNALVFGISPTDRTSEAFLSVAGYPEVDYALLPRRRRPARPEWSARGQGKQVRSIRLTDPAEINTPEVEALIAQSVRSRESAFLAAPALVTIIKSISTKQRPRRPTKSNRDSGQPHSKRVAN